MNYWLLFIPLLTALTGWLVMRLALTLLFRPMKPVKLMGFQWQGILPEKKQQIADNVGKLVANEFSNFNVMGMIGDPKNFEKVRPLIETNIDDFLRNKLTVQMPMIAMFIGDKTINSLKIIFIQEIETLFPQVMEKFTDNLQKDLKIEKMVSSRIAGISSERIEYLFHRNMGKEIRLVSLVGAAIGLGIGILQLVILSLIH